MNLPLSYNLKTFGSSLYNRDYTDISLWESDTDYDLVTATKGEVLECYPDESEYDQSAYCSIGDTITDSNYFRVIKSVIKPKLYNNFEDSVIFNISDDINFEFNENYSSIYNLVLKGNGNILSYTSYNTIENCVCISNVSLYGDLWSIYLQGDNNNIINCLIINEVSPITDTYGIYSDGENNTLYNSTIYNFEYGVHVSNSVTLNSSLYAKNVLYENVDTKFIEDIPGLYNEITSLFNEGILFRDINTYDFRLNKNDILAQNTGTDSSSDILYSFNYDIYGNTRYNWDIGCFGYYENQMSFINDKNIKVRNEIIEFRTPNYPIENLLPLSYNLKTFGEASFGRDYTDISLWESDTDYDLVTATKGEVLECYDDSTNYNINYEIKISGGATDENYFRVIKCANNSCHNEIPYSGISLTQTNSNYYVLISEEDYFKCIGICGRHINIDDSGGHSLFTINGSSSYNVFARCIGFDSENINASFGASCAAFEFSSSGSYNVFLNCLAYEIHAPNDPIGDLGIGFLNSSGNTNYVINCTSCKNGINMVSQGGILSGYNNILEYFTLTNFVEMGGTLNQYYSTNNFGVLFQDADSYNFKLSPFDTFARKNGNNLLNSGLLSTIIIFDDDMISQSRSLTSEWDIGCFSYIPINIDINGNLKCFEIIEDDLTDKISLDKNGILTCKEIIEDDSI